MTLLVTALGNGPTSSRFVVGKKARSIFRTFAPNHSVPDKPIIHHRFPKTVIFVMIKIIYKSMPVPSCIFRIHEPATTFTADFPARAQSASVHSTRRALKDSNENAISKASR